MANLITTTASRSRSRFPETRWIASNRCLSPAPSKSAARLHALLSGSEKFGLARETLLINAAVAAWAHGTAASIAEGFALSREALDSRRALAILTKWQDFSTKL